jgi:hypothetical protein
LDGEVGKLFTNFPMSVPQRRIDDRLHKLWAKVEAASDVDVKAIRQEILTLIHQKSERLKTRAAKLLLKGEHLDPERRSTDVERKDVRK